MSLAGHLRGLESLPHPGRSIELRPYVLAGSDGHQLGRRALDFFSTEHTRKGGGPRRTTKMGVTTSRHAEQCVARAVPPEVAVLYGRADG
ncbi:MAG: hypothetical protein C0497_15100 [Gemmatimonas sp.]|nr:hypothetical protein [Gemmatimonas sp.]